MTYGFMPDNDVYAYNINLKDAYMQFNVKIFDETFSVQLPLIGRT